MSCTMTEKMDNTIQAHRDTSKEQKVVAYTTVTTVIQCVRGKKCLTLNSG